jgi:hypothetical protein
MLWKLVKLDIKSTSRDFAILYTGMFALAILAGTMANELIVFSLALNIAISITVAVVTFVSIIRLFSRRMFSTEGYLTLTLPATSTQTVIAMVLTGAFWSIMTLVMFTLALSTMFMVVLVIEMWGQFSFSSIDWQSLSQLWEAILASELTKDLGFGLLTGIPMGILQMFYSLMILLFVIVFVNTSFVKQSKTLIGIIVYLAISMILNTLRSNIFTKPIDELRFQIISGTDGITQVIPLLSGLENEFSWMEYGGTVLYYIVVLAVFGYLTVWLLNNKLELE